MMDLGRMKIDRQEAFDLGVSVLATALVFSFYTLGLSIRPSEFIFYMAAAVITIGAGFVLHELSHKYYAIKYGARARFVAWPAGLALALAIVVIPQVIWGPGAGFFFIAPGAVYIYATRPISMRENGIISLAGPAANIALSLLFIFVYLLFPSWPLAIAAILNLGVMVNASLALFNLIPFFPLDGSKILPWNIYAWLGAVLFSVLLMMARPVIFGLV